MFGIFKKIIKGASDIILPTKKQIIIQEDTIKNKNSNYKRIIILSDTHGLHRKLYMSNYSDADIIIHAGNFTSIGSDAEVYDFLDWFGSLKIKHKIFILGSNEYLVRNNILYMLNKYSDSGIIYLSDNVQNIEGIEIGGVEGFDKINIQNKKLDILITHYPPLNILDNSIVEEDSSVEVLKFVLKCDVSLHVFGHVRSCRGVLHYPYTTFMNVSNITDDFVDLKYSECTKPFVVDFLPK